MFNRHNQVNSLTNFYLRTRHGVTGLQYFLALLALCSLIGFGQTAKAVVELEAQSAHQLVDLCRVELHFVEPAGALVGDSYELFIEIDGDTPSRSDPHVVASVTTASNSNFDSLSIGVSSDTTLPYLDSFNFRFSRSPQQFMPGERFEYTIYLTLPHDAPPTTEFVFFVDDLADARSEVYSIAKNCPLGN